MEGLSNSPSKVVSMLRRTCLVSGEKAKRKLRNWAKIRGVKRDSLPQNTETTVIGMMTQASKEATTARLGWWYVWTMSAMRFETDCWSGESAARLGISSLRV